MAELPPERCTCIQIDHQHRPHACSNKGAYRGGLCSACRMGRGEQPDKA